MRVTPHRNQHSVAKAQRIFQQLHETIVEERRAVQLPATFATAARAASIVTGDKVHTLQGRMATPARDAQNISATHTCLPARINNQREAVESRQHARISDTQVITRQRGGSPATESDAVMTTRVPHHTMRGARCALRGTPPKTTTEWNGPQAARVLEPRHEEALPGAHRFQFVQKLQRQKPAPAEVKLTSIPARDQ